MLVAQVQPLLCALLCVIVPLCRATVQWNYTLGIASRRSDECEKPTAYGDCGKCVLTLVPIAKISCQLLTLLPSLPSLRC